MVTNIFNTELEQEEIDKMFLSNVLIDYRELYYLLNLKKSTLKDIENSIIKRYGTTKEKIQKVLQFQEEI